MRPDAGAAARTGSEASPSTTIVTASTSVAATSAVPSSSGRHGPTPNGRPSQRDAIHRPMISPLPPIPNQIQPTGRGTSSKQGGGELHRRPP